MIICIYDYVYIYNIYIYISQYTKYIPVILYEKN